MNFLNDEFHKKLIAFKLFNSLNGFWKGNPACQDLPCQSNFLLTLTEIIVSVDSGPVAAISCIHEMLQKSSNSSTVFLSVVK